MAVTIVKRLYTTSLQTRSTRLEACVAAGDRGVSSMALLRQHLDSVTAATDTARYKPLYLKVRTKKNIR